MLRYKIIHKIFALVIIINKIFFGFFSVLFSVGRERNLMKSKCVKFFRSRRNIEKTFFIYFFDLVNKVHLAT